MKINHIRTQVWIKLLLNMRKMYKASYPRINRSKIIKSIVISLE